MRRNGRAQHQQQFLALIPGGDDMHLMYRAGEIGDGLMPVEHGGELDHDRRCLGQQRILQGQHIRRAIGNRVGTRA